MTLSSASTPDQNGTGNDGNEVVLCIPKSWLEVYHHIG